MLEFQAAVHGHRIFHYERCDMDCCQCRLRFGFSGFTLELGLESQFCVNFKQNQSNTSIYPLLWSTFILFSNSKFPTQATKKSLPHPNHCKWPGVCCMETQLLWTFKAEYHKLNDLFWKVETSPPLEGGGILGEGISSCGNRLKSFNSCDLGSLLVFYAVCALIFFLVQTANIKVLF